MSLLRKKHSKKILALTLCVSLFSSQFVAFATPLSKGIKRKDAPDKYKWNLSDIYDSQASFKADIKVLKEQLIPLYSKYKGKLSDPAIFKEYMVHDEKVSKVLEKCYWYANLSRTLDATSSVADELTGVVMDAYTACLTATSFAVPELNGLSKEAFDKLLNDPSLATYSVYLQNVRRLKDHTLSDKEENLISKMADLLEAPSSTYNKITEADYKDPVIKDDKGNEIVLDDKNYDDIMHGTNRKLRKKAFDAVTKSYESQINGVAASYMSEVKKNMVVSKVRKYDSSISAAMAAENVPAAIYSNLVKSVNSNLNYLHKYNKVKKEYFGLDEMFSYDTTVEPVKDMNIEVSYEEAVKLLNKGLAPLGEQYLEDLNKGIDNRWVDVYPDENKQSGAYNIGVTGVHPFVHLNYNNDLNSASTLAHELGHAMNSYYSTQKQPYINANYSIFTAEVASTTNELLIMDYLIKNAKTDAEKLALINQQINNIRGTVYTQVMFAEFEQTIHEIAESGKPLSVDVMNNTWLNILKKYNGSDLTILEQQKYGWSRIPHFYMNFYVYKYATSMSAAYSIVNKIKSGDPKAVENYLEFLGAGGSKDPVALLKDAGVDVNSSEPVDSILRYFGELVDEYEELLNKQKGATKKAA